MPNVKNSILNILSSNDKNKKISIMPDLVQNSDQEIIEKLILLLDDDDISVRGEVFSTLLLNENDISDKLISSLNNERKNIKSFCSLILANRNDKNAINHLIMLTNNSNAIVRSCAFGALGHLGAKNAVKEIHQGVFDSNIEVKKSAAYVLILINERFSNDEKIELEKQQDSDFKKILSHYN